MRLDGNHRIKLEIKIIFNFFPWHCCCFLFQLLLPLLNEPIVRRSRFIGDSRRHVGEKEFVKLKGEILENCTV